MRNVLFLESAAGYLPPPDDRAACRPRCAACCIAPSISTPIPGMPQGKPAGVPCAQLDELLRCRLFGQASRPAVCGSLQASVTMCGTTAAQAMSWLARLEVLTAPSVSDQAAALAVRPTAPRARRG